MVKKKNKKKSKLIAILSVLAVLLIIAGTAAYFLLKKPEGKFIIKFNPAKPEAKEFYDLFQKNKFFEKQIQEINDILILPHDLEIIFTHCEETNAWYDPEIKQLQLCYELIQDLHENFKKGFATEEELDNAIVYATLFIFYHEFGHALSDVLKIPITGKEEDASDQIAILLILSKGGEGEQGLKTAAEWFMQQHEKYKDQPLPFWDEHSLDAQRFYNILCMLYGSNPEKYQHLIENKILPQNRADMCIEDLDKIHRSWNRLLEPNVRKGSVEETEDGKHSI